MTIVTTVTVLAFAQAITLAATGSDNANPTVVISVDLKADMQIDVLRCAETIASQIFATAGVMVTWQSCRAKRNLDQRPVTVEITSRTPPVFHPGALAYAEIFGSGRVHVFYDRIEVANSPKTTRLMLAHVLVHEITHVLQDIDRHSPEGVMKAHWTASDLHKMAWTTLPFHPDDIMLLHAGIAKRLNEEPQLLIAGNRR